MCALRFLTPQGAPTNAAILLFGYDPQNLFPDAYIQFLRIDGVELTDTIRDQKKLTGTIPDQLRQIEELVTLNITIGARIGSRARSE